LNVFGDAKIGRIRIGNKLSDKNFPCPSPKGITKTRSHRFTD